MIVPRKSVVTAKWGGKACPCRIELPPFIPPVGIYCVYGLVDPRDGGVYYVGSTGDFYRRMWQHCHDIPYGTVAFRKRRIDIYDAGLNTGTTIAALFESYEQALDTEFSLLNQFGRNLLNCVQKRNRRND